VAALFKRDEPYLLFNKFYIVRTTTSTVDQPTTSTEKTTSVEISDAQLAKLRDFISEKLSPFQTEFNKEMKKISMQVKYVNQQNADVS
jgi:hypothetical protein